MNDLSMLEARRKRRCFTSVFKARIASTLAPLLLWRIARMPN
ncbi:hypothetical protein VRRI112168_20320 [Vreelandella rituensis]|nr:hypothetical protein [Halomonas rituensis]